MLLSIRAGKPFDDPNGDADATRASRTTERELPVNPFNDAQLMSDDAQRAYDASQQLFANLSPAFAPTVLYPARIALHREAFACRRSSVMIERHSRAFDRQSPGSGMPAGYDGIAAG